MKNTTSPTSVGATLTKKILPEEISRLILRVRGKYVLLSQQLAKLYSLEVKTLNQTVKRNPNFFREESFFQLSLYELRDIQPLVPTVAWGRVNRARPYAFTLNAIIPLQQLLKKHGSDEQHFAIVRAFVNKEKRLKSLIG
jgi:ORF6N domain-containing protein